MALSRRRLLPAKQVVLLSQAYQLDAALDRIAVYFNASVFDEACQAVPMVEGIAEAFVQAGLLRDFRQSRLEPGFRTAAMMICSHCLKTAASPATGTTRCAPRLPAWLGAAGATIAIRTVCGRYRDNGRDDRDLDPLITGARTK
jgi:hypothetical protein